MIARKSVYKHMILVCPLVEPPRQAAARTHLQEGTGVGVDHLHELSIGRVEAEVRGDVVEERSRGVRSCGQTQGGDQGRVMKIIILITTTAAAAKTNSNIFIYLSLLTKVLARPDLRTRDEGEAEALEVLTNGPGHVSPEGVACHLYQRRVQPRRLLQPLQQAGRALPDLHDRAEDSYIEALIFQHFRAHTPTFDRTFVEVLGISMASFMSLVIV